MIFVAPISVFVLSFAAFTFSVFFSWVVADAFGIIGQGAVLGAIASLFLALVLTVRRESMGRIILAGALAGLIALPAAYYINAQWEWFASGIILGLALGTAHWASQVRQISPTWILISMFSWAAGLGVIPVTGDFFGIILGAIMFALVNTLASAQPFGIVHGWATRTGKRVNTPLPGSIRSALPEPPGQSSKKQPKVEEKTFMAQRANARRRG